MFIYIFAALIILFILLVVQNIKARKPSNKKAKILIKSGYFHHNGNLDFYVSEDDQFISRSNNHAFPLAEVKKITAFVDGTIIFTKDSQQTLLYKDQINELFSGIVSHIDYAFELNDGTIHEAVVDIATTKRPKQREELRQSLEKLINFLNKVSLPKVEEKNEATTVSN